MSKPWDRSPSTWSWSSKVDAVFKWFPVVTICAYDVRAFDVVTVIEALKLHSDMFGPQVGYWLN